VVEKVEFLGAYSRLTFRLSGIDQPLLADLSVNDMAEFHLRPGDTLRVALRRRSCGCSPHMSASLAGRSGILALRASRLSVHWTDRIAHALLVAAGLALALFLLAPLATILAKSVEDRAGEFVGLRELRRLLPDAGADEVDLEQRLVSALVTAITIPPRLHLRVRAHAKPHALEGAPAQHRARADPRPVAARRDLLHLLVRQPGIAQALDGWRPDLRRAGNRRVDGVRDLPARAHDPRHGAIAHRRAPLRAADALGTTAQRKFFTITVPGAKYGLISAAMVVFTYALSDFGIPKVIGGNFNMLATDIFKLVIGQQDFAKGAVVGIILLAPVAVTYFVDAYVQKRQSALLSARSVPYVPRPSPRFDASMAAFCWLLAILMLAVLGMAIYASFVKLWPYNFSFSLDHYRLGLVDAGIFGAYLNSLHLAFWCATLGTVFIFATAYLLEKTRGLGGWRAFVRLMAVLPMGVPGMVLGLGYIFFFVRESNPLHFIYGTLAILVVNTVVHYYTSSHLTAVTALSRSTPSSRRCRRR